MPRLPRLLPFLIVCWAFFSGSDPGAAGEPEPEAVRWLREYLQIDTTNPPGNEAEAAHWLAERLRTEGFEPRLLSDPTGRTSLYARWASPRDPGRSLVLMHHIDVVPAGEPWQVEPFSGRPIDGVIWGRGAIDVKSLGIAQLAAMVALRREGIELDHDVIFLAVADEEVGGRRGTAWLLEEHADLFADTVAVLNEGGSNRVVADRLLWWGIEVTQKRPLWLRVTASGRGGHGSGFNPGSASHQLLRGLARLVDRPPTFRLTDAARAHLGAVAELEGGSAEEMVAHLETTILPEGPTEPLGPDLPVFFVDTVQVTEITASRGPNVVAPTATASIDIRLLPDTDADAFLAEVRALLGPRLEVEVVLDSPPAPPAPLDHPVFHALERALAVRAPVIPTFMAGTTDSRYFRQRGIPAYGFSPFSLSSSEMRGIHAVDEAIPADELLRGVEMQRRVLLEIAGTDG